MWAIEVYESGNWRRLNVAKGGQGLTYDPLSATKEECETIIQCLDTPARLVEVEDASQYKEP